MSSLRGQKLAVLKFLRNLSVTCIVEHAVETQVSLRTEKDQSRDSRVLESPDPPAPANIPLEFEFCGVRGEWSGHDPTSERT